MFKPANHAIAGAGVCTICKGKKWIAMQKDDGKLQKVKCPGCCGNGKGYATK